MLKHYPITVVWATRPERQKGAKDEIKGPARSQDPEAPLTSTLLLYNVIYHEEINNIILT